jgi:hypothetical protein
MMRLINGNYANNDNVIARCHILIHRGYLTKGLAKAHSCISKKCTFFEKLKPEYWQTLERLENEKKENRLKRKQAVEILNDRDIFIRETLEDSGHIHITLIREEPRNLLVVYYIYDKRINLDLEVKFLSKKLKKTIKLQTRTGSDEAIEQLIRKPRRETRKVTDLRKAPKVGIAVKKRLAALGVYCLEDLFGRSGDVLYRLDCEISGEKVNRRYLTAYRSAVIFANENI